MSKSIYELWREWKESDREKHPYNDYFNKTCYLPKEKIPKENNIIVFKLTDKTSECPPFVEHIKEMSRGYLCHLYHCAKWEDLEECIKCVQDVSLLGDEIKYDLNTDTNINYA